MRSKIYVKPKMTSKKVKISHFLSKVFWMDQFNFVGNVYAQSGGPPGDGGYGGRSDGSYADCSTAGSTTSSLGNNSDGGYGGISSMSCDCSFGS